MVPGVPQGSCLGPLLFTVCVNDINDQIKYCSIPKYADDIKINKSFSCYSHLSSKEEVKFDLNSLASWSQGWQLNFKVNKCSVLHFGKGN